MKWTFRFYYSERLEEVITCAGLGGLPDNNYSLRLSKINAIIEYRIMNRHKSERTEIN